MPGSIYGYFLPDHRVMKSLFKGIHPAFFRYGKCQISLISKPKRLVGGGWFKITLSIFPPEQDVLKCTAACLVSFGKSDLIKITFVGTHRCKRKVVPDTVDQFNLGLFLAHFFRCRLKEKGILNRNWEPLSKDQLAPNICFLVVSRNESSFI